MAEQDWGPGDEEIAALASGNLRGREKARVIAHLNRDPEAYQQFLETVQLLEAVEESEEEEPPLSGSGWSASRRWMAVAAGVVLAAALAALGFLYLQPRAEGEALAWATLLERHAGQTLADDTWRQPGISSFSPSLTAQRAAFRLGRSLVDAAVARRESAAQAWRLHLNELGDLLEAFPSHEQLVNRIRSAPGVSSKEAGALVSEIEQAASRKGPSSYLRLGQWAEASRLAAASRSGAFFSSQAFREGLGEAVAREEFEPALKKELRRAQELTAQGEPADDQLPALQRIFSDIIRLM